MAGAVRRRFKPIRRSTASPPRGPYVARRCAEAAPERPVEIGEVVEARFICNGADKKSVVSRIVQHAVRAGQTLRQHEIGECRAVLGEELPDIAFGKPVVLGRKADRKIVLSEVFNDRLPDRVKTRGAYA